MFCVMLPPSSDSRKFDSAVTDRGDHRGENISDQNPETCFAFVLPFMSYSRNIDLATTDAPPSGEKIFIRKPDPTFKWSVDMFSLNLTVFE
jgi:hypothetical protein